LRGVNVGGKNRLAMADLAAMFAAAGGTDVRTYIQSGNVIFTCAPSRARQLPDEVGRLLAAKLGTAIPVIVRSAAELADAVTANPYRQRAADESALHVAFLSSRPTRVRAATLDAQRSSGDSFELRGREIYLHLPNGVARTKLTNAYFDARLAVTSTMRNWRTVMKLLELTENP